MQHANPMALTPLLSTPPALPPSSPSITLAPEVTVAAPPSATTSTILCPSEWWFAGKSRCHQKIRITARNGKSAVARVVDECDSVNGCDKEHAYQPPCKTNIVDASQTVWNDLGLDTNEGQQGAVWRREITVSEFTNSNPITNEKLNK
ncbi:ripening-related protein grip22-like [Senna tora]|uniref:Ripening-related protein grip22-like n=1 Tax=Senna tora TaxID=362788 RepID=A0A834X327_9FABA|nr:ripening-related protein grip22-like [Senna tora]